MIVGESAMWMIGLRSVDQSLVRSIPHESLNAIKTSSSTRWQPAILRYAQYTAISNVFAVIVYLNTGAAIRSHSSGHNSAIGSA
jgi:hypothetical protein